MKIYLVRHGIAGDHVFGSPQADAQRKLTSEGKAETKRVAQGVKCLGVKPQLIVSSPLVRAKETAEIFQTVFSVKEEMKIIDALAPGGTPSSVYKSVKLLLKAAFAEEIMLFGHEPDMGNLAGNLLSFGSDLDIPFKKSGVCRIDVSDIPPTQPGVLKWFVTPKIASMLNDK
jgi:phosphohistidine phosphatase